MINDEELFDPDARGLDGTATGNERNTILTFTGRVVDPYDMKPDDFTIADIAHSLSLQCRYGGHSHGFYPVAQHSIFVKYYLEHRYPKERLLHRAGLLHDAAEAYIGDIVRPLKRRPEYVEFLMAEKAIEVRLNDVFCINVFDDRVKEADNAVLQSELDWGRRYHDYDWRTVQADFLREYHSTIIGRSI